MERLSHRATRRASDVEVGEALEKQLAKAIEKGRSTPEKAKAILDRIRPTADYALVSEADVVVEAVFEDRAVKAAGGRYPDAQRAATEGNGAKR